MRLPLNALALAAVSDLDGEPITGEVSGLAADQMRVCEICGKPITAKVWPSSVERGDGRFCSYRCMGTAGGRSTRGEKKNRSAQLLAYHARRREGRA